MHNRSFLLACSARLMSFGFFIKISLRPQRISNVAYDHFGNCVPDLSSIHDLLTKVFGIYIFQLRSIHIKVSEYIKTASVYQRLSSGIPTLLGHLHEAFVYLSIS